MLLGRGPTQRTPALNSLPRGGGRAVSAVLKASDRSPNPTQGRFLRPRCGLPTAPVPTSPHAVSLRLVTGPLKPTAGHFPRPRPVLTCTPGPRFIPRSKPGYGLTISIHLQVSPASSLLRKKFSPMLVHLRKIFSLSRFSLIPV